MPRSIVDRRFHADLVNRIMAAGISQNALADQAHVSHSYLSEIINGHKTPSLRVVNALDRALGCGGKLAALVAVGVTDADQDHLAAAIDAPRRIGQSTVEAFARTLAAQRELDDTLGSAAMLAPVTAQLQTIARMVNAVTGPHRSALMGQAAQWAQFAGWLHTSTGQWDHARQWFGRALEWSSEAGDPDLIATVLSYQGHVAWLNLQYAPVVGLSHAALRDPTVYPGQRAYDAYQAARGHAAAGEPDDAVRMLHLGDELAEQSASYAGPVPAWQYYRASWFFRLERGYTALHLSRSTPGWATAAVDDLRAGLAGVPVEMRGADWAAEYTAHLAGALIGVGELDEASVELGRARVVAEATGSRRVGALVDWRERRLLSLRQY